MVFEFLARSRDSILALASPRQSPQRDPVDKDDTDVPELNDLTDDFTCNDGETDEAADARQWDAVKQHWKPLIKATDDMFINREHKIRDHLNQAKSNNEFLADVVEKLVCTLQHALAFSEDRTSSALTRSIQLRNTEKYKTFYESSKKACATRNKPQFIEHLSFKLTCLHFGLPIAPIGVADYAAFGSGRAFVIGTKSPAKRMRETVSHEDRMAIDVWADEKRPLRFLNGYDERAFGKDIMRTPAQIWELYYGMPWLPPKGLIPTNPLPVPMSLRGGGSGGDDDGDDDDDDNEEQEEDSNDDASGTDGQDELDDDDNDDVSLISEEDEGYAQPEITADYEDYAGGHSQDGKAESEACKNHPGEGAARSIFPDLSWGPYNRSKTPARYGQPRWMFSAVGRLQFSTRNVSSVLCAMDRLLGLDPDSRAGTKVTIGVYAESDPDNEDWMLLTYHDQELPNITFDLQQADPAVVMPWLSDRVYERLPLECRVIYFVSHTADSRLYYRSDDRNYQRGVRNLWRQHRGKLEAVSPKMPWPREKDQPPFWRQCLPEQQLLRNPNRRQGDVVEISLGKSVAYLRFGTDDSVETGANEYEARFDSVLRILEPFDDTESVATQQAPYIAAHVSRQAMLRFKGATHCPFTFTDKLPYTLWSFLWHEYASGQRQFQIICSPMAHVVPAHYDLLHFRDVSAEEHRHVEGPNLLGIRPIAGNGWAFLQEACKATLAAKEEDASIIWKVVLDTTACTDGPHPGRYRIELTMALSDTGNDGQPREVWTTRGSERSTKVLDTHFAHLASLHGDKRAFEHNGRCNIYLQPRWHTYKLHFMQESGKNSNSKTTSGNVSLVAAGGTHITAKTTGTELFDIIQKWYGTNNTTKGAPPLDWANTIIRIVQEAPDGFTESRRPEFRFKPRSGKTGGQDGNRNWDLCRQWEHLMDTAVCSSNLYVVLVRDVVLPKAKIKRNGGSQWLEAIAETKYGKVDPLDLVWGATIKHSRQETIGFGTYVDRDFSNETTTRSPVVIKDHRQLRFAAEPTKSKQVANTARTFALVRAQPAETAEDRASRVQGLEPVRPGLLPVRPAAGNMLNPGRHANSAANPESSTSLREYAYGRALSIGMEDAYPQIPINAPPLEHLIRHGHPSIPLVSTQMLTPTEQRKLQVDFFQMRQIALQRVQKCPYKDCTVYMPLAEEARMQRHLDEKHVAIQCPFCDERLFKHWSPIRRLGHMYTAHGDLFVEPAQASISRAGGKRGQSANRGRDTGQGSGSGALPHGNTGQGELSSGGKARPSARAPSLGPDIGIADISDVEPEPDADVASGVGAGESSRSNNSGPGKPLPKSSRKRGHVDEATQDDEPRRDKSKSGDAAKHRNQGPPAKKRKSNGEELDREYTPDQDAEDDDEDADMDDLDLLDEDYDDDDDDTEPLMSGALQTKGTPKKGTPRKGSAGNDRYVPTRRPSDGDDDFVEGLVAEPHPDLDIDGTPAKRGKGATKTVQLVEPALVAARAPSSRKAGPSPQEDADSPASMNTDKCLEEIRAAQSAVEPGNDGLPTLQNHAPVDEADFDKLFGKDWREPLAAEPKSKPKPKPNPRAKSASPTKKRARESTPVADAAVEASAAKSPAKRVRVERSMTPDVGDKLPPATPAPTPAPKGRKVAAAAAAAAVKKTPAKAEPKPKPQPKPKPSESPKKQTAKTAEPSRAARITRSKTPDRDPDGQQKGKSAQPQPSPKPTEKVSQTDINKKRPAMKPPAAHAPTQLEADEVVAKQSPAKKGNGKTPAKAKEAAAAAAATVGKTPAKTKEVVKKNEPAAAAAAVAVGKTPAGKTAGKKAGDATPAPPATTGRAMRSRK